MFCENMATQKLAGAIRNEPDALLQILLALIGDSIRKRIIGAPAYAKATQTSDLQLRLGLLVDGLHSDPFAMPEVLGQLYRSAVSKRHVKDYGQFFTPSETANRVIEDLHVNKDDVVLDAGSGTGIFPVAAPPCS